MKPWQQSYERFPKTLEVDSPKSVDEQADWRKESAHAMTLQTGSAGYWHDTLGQLKRGGEVPGAQLSNPQPVLMVRTK